MIIMNVTIPKSEEIMLIDTVYCGTHAERSFRAH
jgi:hypothetical protein